MDDFNKDDELPETFSRVSEDDLAWYLPELNELSIPEEQKIALLETLFDIMRRFVEMGFAPPDVCGYVFGEAAALLPDGPEQVDSSSDNKGSPDNGDEEGAAHVPD